MILFEMLKGISLYSGTNSYVENAHLELTDEKLQKRLVKHGFSENDPVSEVLFALLKPVPESRLQFLEDAKKFEFFANFDWNALELRMIKQPKEVKLSSVDVEDKISLLPRPSYSILELPELTGKINVGRRSAFDSSSSDSD